MKWFKHGIGPVAWLVAILLWTCLLGAWKTAYAAEEKEAPRVLVEWRFDTPATLEEWSTGAHIAHGRVRDGALVGETVDWDPILIGPVFEIPAQSTQQVEIRIRTPRGGEGQLFWTETLEGSYGGFSQAKCCTFRTQSSDAFQTIRIDPFWHAAGKIIRLRVDPPATGKFAIQWIRITEEANPKTSSASAWEFASGLEGWRAWRDASQLAVSDGRLRVAATGPAPAIASPLVSIAANAKWYICLRMAVDRGGSGRVFCVSDSQFGHGEVAFPLRADGQMHTYNIDVGHLDHWRDTIIMIGVQPSDAEGAQAVIESIEIGQAPRGPAELEIGYFGQAEGVNRVGRPAQVTLLVRNIGGEVAENVTSLLAVDAPLRVVGSPTQSIENLTHWLPQAVTWQVEAARPGGHEVTVKIDTPGGELSETASIEFTPVPEIPRTSYIPEPRPVACPYEVGAFYFPGWPNMSRWQPILDFPMRKPVLGWYDEANPECADWQIKWAVEHGVSFFMVDWYWCEGNRHLEHWLHDAYMNARFRKYLKWCVMWANHNPPGTHSLEDWREVTQYWIDNYFGMETYYRIDGRPAVFIWSPGNIRRDLGGSEKAAELYALSQRMAREAGLPGIYFVAMSSHESEAACRQLAAEGYEAMTSYHGFQLAAARAGTNRFPFADVVATGPEVWREADQRAESAELLYMPIVDTGWASQPWHGKQARVLTDRTPELFGELCRKARDYADRTDKKIIAIGPWNEWGEGSYIEPYAEYGFADLDALREAFCPTNDWPRNIVPADVGRGPYDLPPPERKTQWHFDGDGDFEGWSPNGYIKAEVRSGLLHGEATGHDPILSSPGVQMLADQYSRVTIRMRADSDDMAQLFWATADSSISEANSVRFRVVGDGEFHDYQIDLSATPQWRGLITSLRFDPAATAGTKFAIDSIRCSQP